MVVSYKVVYSDYLPDLCENVEAQLREGWVLVGGIVIKDKEYLQTLTLEKDKVIPKKKAVPKKRAKKAVAPKRKKE